MRRPASSGHGSRARLINLVVFLASIVVSLAIAEGVVRARFPHLRDTAIPGHIFLIDDVLGWKFRAGATSVHRTRHFAVEYVINASGFRDRPRSGPSAPGTYRILLYGDSLMFGWGVPQADRFSDLLEKDIPGVEVWNHAVPGYGLDQEVLSYERDAESVVFDEAMFFVAKGTLLRTHDRYIYAKYKPVFSYDDDRGLRLHPVPALGNMGVNLLYRMLSPLYLPYFVQDRVALVRQTLAGGASPAGGPADEPRYVDALAEALLQRARATTRREHQRMSVLVGDVWGSDRDEVRRFCERNDIEVLEVPPYIAATSIGDWRMDLVLGRYDRHWNAIANRLLADELQTRIRGRAPR